MKAHLVSIPGVAAGLPLSELPQPDDDAVDDGDDDDDHDDDDDDDDDAVTGVGSCGSSCWVSSSREHTGPRNRASPGALAAGGTRLHVDETTWTTIDRYPRSIRAPGGEPHRGGQRCSRDSQGHGVTCHEDIPTNEELPSPGASHHPRSRFDRSSNKLLFLQIRGPSHSRFFLLLCVRLFFSPRGLDVAKKTDRSKQSTVEGERFTTHSSQRSGVRARSREKERKRRLPRGTPDQGTASRPRGCSRRWTTTGKRNVERSMVGPARRVGRDRRESERFERASRWPATLPSRGTARHADLTSTCARAARKRARPSERANEPNERTNERTWNESRERKERSPLGGSAPRRAAPRISNAVLRARTFVARFATHHRGPPRLRARTTENWTRRVRSPPLDRAPDDDRESRFSLGSFAILSIQARLF
ncbi:hypothetical protein K0M31_011983 [Melipona bicolor]|uniref:Uncharacterized protein n=1 Tax=Melipona bicolor TaxID=60889 RepID=A0AA40GBD9_9HYME|nr:hypothetical protein K0M31_011983 [Melipona bicolor]